MRNINRAIDRHWIYIALAFIAFVTSVIFSTNLLWNVGVDSDGLLYLSSAQNLALGHGLQWLGESNTLHPLIHYPPLYPSLLAVLIALGFNPFQAATGLSVILIGLNTLVFGLLIYSFTENKLATIAGAAFFAISPFIIKIHQMALSEPLFILCVSLSLGFLVQYLKKSQPGWLTAAAVSAALAYLSREAGIALISTGIIIIMVFRNASIRRRAGESAFFAVISIIPISIWYFRNILQANSATNRVFLIHPPTWEARKQGMDTLISWFYPNHPAPVVRLEYFLIGGLFVLFLLWFSVTLNKTFGKRFKLNVDNHNLNPHQFIATWLLFAIIYAIILVISLTFFDASIPMDHRILAPIYIAILVAAFVEIAISSLKLLIPMAIFGMLLIVMYISVTNDLLFQLRTEGIGFSSKAWVQSRLVEYVHEASPGSLLYSNNAIALEFLTGKQVKAIPEMFDPVKSQPNAEYNSQLASMREELQRPRSALLLFTSDENLSTAYRSELSIGFQMLMNAPDGIIYVYPDNIENNTLP